MGGSGRLRTAISSSKGHEEALGQLRPSHAVGDGAGPGHGEDFGSDRQPYVLILGGGQGGIMLAARLRQLAVPTLIVDKNERPGDGWRKRYKTLVLHNPIWENRFPYLDFPRTGRCSCPRSSTQSGWRPIRG